ncbi:MULTISPECIES: 30S ribosome-binding factor RbfA [unclassified Thauera]|uniref:30S ribosome-binding factor RbfA n=1 Tax=unclassified Thauera TaxID=2609274 RepID=UPI000E8ED462|nr:MULTISPECIES: 30S ribosome-binding factor RbfA [unclassified Thauera]WBL62933.1 30S ribosome-binding factor RbfA [Thauera sp. WB-2]HAY11380.1 30S ribosome-binding factor RbfA [Thauera sp.]HRJ22490.1 30S ribosome-binding factor RbfA [Thauera sp.]HRK09577.1 30S ribosome-binding factor RbfA [Thauera sp.]
MPKEYSRSQRVVEQIRRELAELIRLEVKDPRVGFITLTDVEITPDYAHAKVFFTSMTGEGDVPEIQQGLRRASGFLRRELGRRIRIHTIPELHFHYDRSVEEGSRLSQLIDAVVKEDESRHQDAPSADETGGERAAGKDDDDKSRA